jgi:hypothetical protein
LSRGDANVGAIVGSKGIASREIHDESHALVRGSRVERQDDGGFLPRREIETP